MSSAVNRLALGARLPSMPCAFSTRISLLLAFSGRRFMFSIACRMLARNACSEVADGSPLAVVECGRASFGDERITFASNSRTTNNGPSRAPSGPPRRKQVTDRAGFRTQVNMEKWGEKLWPWGEMVAAEEEGEEVPVDGGDGEEVEAMEGEEEVNSDETIANDMAAKGEEEEDVFSGATEGAVEEAELSCSERTTGTAASCMAAS